MAAVRICNKKSIYVGNSTSVYNNRTGKPQKMESKQSTMEGFNKKRTKMENDNDYRAADIFSFRNNHVIYIIKTALTIFISQAKTEKP